ncbi:AAA domain-containing protein [Nocardia sp. NPDC051570]|uniref:AAA domain-containing protein n=1 Tax=Nocardia sp. NPDC051570 TaxID=3364324 RepID=UPI0037B5E792
MEDTDRQPRPDDASIRQDAIKLVEYARDTAVAGSRDVVDVKSYPNCWWLNEFPAGVEFRDTPAADGSLARVPYKRIPSAPAVPEPLRECLEEKVWSDADVANADVSERLAAAVDSGNVRRATHDRALSLRQDWLDRVAAVRDHHKLYELLRERVQSLDTEDDKFELLLCSGLFVGTDPKLGVVRRHLLTKRCWARVDKKSSAILIGADANSPLQFEDRRFLVRVFGDQLERVTELRDEVAESDLLPHAPDEPSKWLAEWTHRMLPDGPAYSASRVPPPREEKATSVTAAPALIFRQRDRSGVVTFFERMLEQLRSGRAVVPLGLYQLLHTPDETHQRSWLAALGAVPDNLLSDDPLFYKETNAEQRKVLDRVRRFSGAVVQGPPGTGKTHTIANLLGAMLADGLRVLVVSQREQPLRVLRDKLPEKMQPLCVSMAAKRGSENGLEASVRDMQARLSPTDAVEIAKTVEQLSEQRRVVQRKVTALEEELAQLLRSEHDEFPEVAPGYGGLLAEIAERVADRTETFAWFPALPSSAPALCPLSIPDMRDLLTLSREHPEGPVRAEQFLPDSQQIPAPDVVAETVRAIAAPSVDNPLIERLAPVEFECLDNWRKIAWRVIELVDHLNQVAAQGFPPIGRGVLDILSGQNADAWTDVLKHDGIAADLERRYRAPELHDLQRTARTPEEWAAVRQAVEPLRKQARRLQEGLERGEPLRIKVLRIPTEFGKATTNVRQAFTYQGTEPTTPQAARAIVEYLDVIAGMRTLDRVWGHVSSPPEWSDAELVRLSQRRATEQHLGVLRELVEKATELREGLATHRVLVILTPDAWQGFAEAVDGALARHHANTVRETYDEWISQWKTFAEQPDPAPEISVLLDALHSRDLDAYRVAHDGIPQARSSVAQQRRYRDLLDKFSEAHPQLAQDMTRTCVDSGWDTRIAEMDEAWSWGLADRFLRTRFQSELIAKRESDLVAAKALLLKVTADLATEQAWGHCLNAMTADDRRALKSFEVLAQKQGPGRGDYTADYRRAAKDAMKAAKNSVLAWVMPIPKVAEMVEPQPNSFDVVIVDEASQAAMSSIFLLWLAPRIIVVGDDKQCAPQSSTRNLGEVLHRLRGDFPNIKEHIRIQLLPNGNLYNILGCAFPNVVTLTEHFRCMPEIIDWPSHQFYGNRLAPLRQYGASRLEPVVIERVEGGEATGTNENMANRPEAHHIVATIKACLADPEYADKTLGVIALRSRGQRRLIQHLLLQQVPAEQIERHEITVGSAAEFQGDERDVMIVSTVVARHVRQMRRDTAYNRDLNVAVTETEFVMSPGLTLLRAGWSTPVG